MSTVNHLRCLAVWAGATAALGSVGVWATAGLSWAASRSFDTALPALAAAVLLACATWAWVVTTIVVAEALRVRRGARAVPGTAPSRTAHPCAAPPWARRLVLAACGVAIVGAVQVAPAQAAPGGAAGGPAGSASSSPHRGAPGALDALRGLSLPDRTTGGLAPSRATPRTAPPAAGPGPAAAAVSAAAAAAAAAARSSASLVVQPGDSLWSLAARALPTDAPAADVATLVTRLYDLNRSRIGSDPDLIRPGAVLLVPAEMRPTR